MKYKVGDILEKVNSFGIKSEIRIVEVMVISNTEYYVIENLGAYVEHGFLIKQYLESKFTPVKYTQTTLYKTLTGAES